MELTEIEFVALMVITIASTSKKSVRMISIMSETIQGSETNCSDLIKIGDDYSIRVYQELHALYRLGIQYRYINFDKGIYLRDEFKLDNYASRFGQFMTLANALQVSQRR